MTKIIAACDSSDDAIVMLMLDETAVQWLVDYLPAEDNLTKQLRAALQAKA